MFEKDLQPVFTGDVKLDQLIVILSVSTALHMKQKDIVQKNLHVLPVYDTIPTDAVPGIRVGRIQDHYLSVS